MLATPFGAASKPLLPPTKNHEVQFGALCLKMREPSLNEKCTTFIKFILSKFLEDANHAMPPRPATGGTMPQQNFLPHFSDFAPPKKIQIRKKKILFRRSALSGRRRRSDAREQKVSLPLKLPSTFCPLAEMRLGVLYTDLWRVR
ncbi:MAG: hypothetical protein A3E18_02255 [Candidatus Nealsonbacteria bacterium RIFCSPHIGHO2_12_FULL_38_18]|nr:MAG: hypothetical protein A3E18_02255 [Candidatus Nealsonbacteria bacterium RIFCSPHIGHO2_12_FULL_38_18]